MRTVTRQYLPLLEQTIELVVKCYAAVHHHKLLDTAAQVSTHSPGHVFSPQYYPSLLLHYSLVLKLVWVCRYVLYCTFFDFTILFVICEIFY